jgi:hypothetical protein
VGAAGSRGRQQVKEGTRVYRQDTAGSGKNLKRQANQKYHQNGPSVSCGAHSGVKRIAFHYLAKAEGEPRDLSKKRPSQT